MQSVISILIESVAILGCQRTAAPVANRVEEICTESRAADTWDPRQPAVVSEDRGIFHKAVALIGRARDGGRWRSHTSQMLPRKDARTSFESAAIDLPPESRPRLLYRERGFPGS
jgi:hypothetical protein